MKNLKYTENLPSSDKWENNYFLHINGFHFLTPF